jgi:hypothetical protein
MPSNLSRRDLLTRSTELAALGASGALAGCTELDVLGGPDAALTDQLRPWLPAPGALTDTGPEASERFANYSVNAFDQAAIRSGSDRLHAAVGQRYGELLESLDLALGDLRMSASLGFFPTVLAIDHDPDAVEAALDGERVGTAGDFRLLRNRDTTDDDFERLFAADGSYLVSVPIGRFAIDAREVAETLIRTRAGEQRRYVEADDDLGVVFDRVGGAVGLNASRIERVGESEESVETGYFAGTVANGTGFVIDGDHLLFRRITVFADEDAVDRAKVDEYVAAATADDSGPFDLEHRETDVGGRVAEVVMATDLADVPTPSRT